MQLLIALGVLNNLSAFIGGGHSHGTDLSRAPLLSHLHLVTPVCLKPEQKLCSIDPREYKRTTYYFFCVFSSEVFLKESINLFLL